MTLLVVAVISAGVVAYLLIPSKPTGRTAEYVYPTADGNPTISAKVGEVFAIQLSSNAGSTGYDWSVSCSDGVRYINYTVVSTSSLVGGPQVRNYFFHALSAGSQTITLVDRRSFAENDVAATISVRVTVS